MNKKSAEITEYIFFLLSVFGTVAAILNDQMLYAAVPITLSLGWYLVIRRLHEQGIQFEFIKNNQTMSNIEQRLEQVDAWKEYFALTVQREVYDYIQGQKEENQDLITHLQEELAELKQFQENKSLVVSQIQQQVDLMVQQLESLESSLEERFNDLSEKTHNSEFINVVNRRLQKLESSWQELNKNIHSLNNFHEEFKLSTQEKLADLQQDQECQDTLVSTHSQLLESFDVRFQEMGILIENTKNNVLEEIKKLEIVKNAEIEEMNQVIDQITKVEPLEAGEPEISTVTETVITNKPSTKETISELVPAMTLRGHKDKVLSVVFSPDGQVLASGSDDKTINLWNIQTRKVHILKGHKGSTWSGGINSLAFSPDGKFLASGSDDKTINLWNLEIGEKVFTLTGHSERVYCVVISSDGKILASGSQDKNVKLWSLETGEILATLEIHQDEVLSLAFSPDGEILASGGGGNDKTIKLYNLANKKIQTIIGHSDWFGGIKCLAFSPDGEILASGSNDKTIKLWRVETGEEISTLTGHQDDVCSVAFSPDGEILASGSKDKTIKLWQIETAKEISTFVSSRDEVYSVAFSPDGRMLAAGNGDHTIKLFSHF